MTAKNRQGLNIVVVYIVVWIAVQILQVLLALPYINSEGVLDMTDAQYFRFVSITNLALYLTLFLIFIYMLRDYLKEQITFTKANIHEFIKITIIGVFGLFAAIYATSVVMMLLDASENSENQEILNSLVNAATFDKLALILFSVVLAPFVEEIVFRRAVFGFLEKKSIALAIIVSGLSFGFIHVLAGDYIQLIIYGSLGLVLAYAYYRSEKNIMTVIAIHMIYNLITAIVMFTY